MKVSIVTIGSRGDLQPYLAVAKALIVKGHQVKLAAPSNFEDWIQSEGVPYVSLGTDISELMEREETKKALGGNPFAIARMWKTTIIPMMEATFNATWEAAADAEVIIYHPKAFCAVDVSEKTGAKLIMLTPLPIHATAEFPLVVFGSLKCSCLNRPTYLVSRFKRFAYRNLLRKWRQEKLGLQTNVGMFTPSGQSLDGSYHSAIVAVSPAVLPRPRDWPAEVQVLGYCFRDQEKVNHWEPSASLRKFLNRCERKPVYIGFGSMTVSDPLQLATAVVEGVQRSGLCAILCTGWGALDNARQVLKAQYPDTVTAEEAEGSDFGKVFVMRQVPHEPLFASYVDAVVHHGGAGTVAAGLRAGLPTLVCPFGVDQPFWGHRVHQLKCGPKALARKSITSSKFAAALRDLTSNSEYRKNAQHIADSIAKEDGVAEVVKVVEEQGDQNS